MKLWIKDETKQHQELGWAEHEANQFNMLYTDTNNKTIDDIKIK